MTIETAAIMDSKEPEEKSGQKKYSRVARMYKEGYLSVVIYKNVYQVPVMADGTTTRIFYDIVPYRKIKDRYGNSEYKRGTNLKPNDLPLLQKLLQEAHEYLKAITDE